MSTLRIAVVIASTRPTRVGPHVTAWVMQHLEGRDDASYDVVDLQEVGLPFLDEPEPASSGHYTQQHTRDWAEMVDGYDDMEDFSQMTPRDFQAGNLSTTVDQLVRWAKAMRGIRH